MGGVAQLATCPTPMAGSPATETYNAAGNSDYSRRIVELASVCTPTVAERLNGRSPETIAKLAEKRLREHGQRTVPIYLTEQVLLATTATPRAEDSECTGAHRGTADTLHSQTKLATLTSPSARDWKDTSGMSESGVDPDGSTRSRLDQLPRQAQLADSGETATGGSGVMESTVPLVQESPRSSQGQLNPAYSRWLMGLPPAWDWCAMAAARRMKALKKPSRKQAKQG